MLTINKVLQRVFTEEFYRLNAMFFLLVLGIVGGFMSAREHIAMAEFLVSSPAWTAIPGFLWILYGIKIHWFNKQVCRAPEMKFVRDIVLLPSYQQKALSFLVVANQSLPSLAYGIFLLVVAIRNGLLISAVAIFAWLLLSLIIFSFLLSSIVGTLKNEHEVSRVKQWIDRWFQRTFEHTFIEWLVRSQPGLVTLTKVFGCLLLFGICQLYHYDEYDHRLLALGVLIAAGANLAMVHHYVTFENQIFFLTRNLPVQITRRMMQFILTMLLLNLPELLVLFRNYPEQLNSFRIFEMVAFSLSILMTGYCFLLSRNVAFETLSGFTFGFVIVLFVLILSKVPLWLLAGIGIIGSTFLYQRLFYKFEIVADPNRGNGD